MGKKEETSIYSGAGPEKVAADLRELMNFQDEGMSLPALEALIAQKLIPHFVRYDLPEFHSLYNFFPEEGAEFGAEIALHYNQGVTNWIVSPGAVMVEELCTQAFCRIFELSPEADATFMYCGTYSNQQALYMALHRKAEKSGFNLADTGLQGFADPKRLAVAASTEAHFSLKHAVRMLGLGEQSLDRLPVDSNQRMDTKLMRQTIEKISRTRNIFCIVSTAGTTATGSVDPILPAAELCREIDAWLHVDGAYGMAYYLLPKLKHLFSGIDLADSITFDPHKQFGVPIPNSLLFVRNRKDFERLAIYGSYFNRKDDPEPNPGLKSPPSTRPFSALPLVTSMRFLGMKKIRQRLQTPITAIHKLADKLKNQEDIELCHLPDLGFLCFRIIPQGFPSQELNNLQKFVYEKIKKGGIRTISITQLGNKTVLRFVTVAPNVTVAALSETIQEIRLLTQEYQKRIMPDSTQ